MSDLMNDAMIVLSILASILGIGLVLLVIKDAGSKKTPETQPSRRTQHPARSSRSQRTHNDNDYSPPVVISTASDDSSSSSSSSCSGSSWGGSSDSGSSCSGSFSSD